MRSIKLHKLLSLVEIVPTSGLINPEITNISFNSKEVEKGTLFSDLGDEVIIPSPIKEYPLTHFLDIIPSNGVK